MFNTLLHSVDVSTVPGDHFRMTATRTAEPTASATLVLTREEFANLVAYMATTLADTSQVCGRGE
jgi:hypothetical protein